MVTATGLSSISGEVTNPVVIGIQTVALSLQDGGFSEASAFEQAKPAKAMKRAA